MDIEGIDTSKISPLHKAWTQKKGVNSNVSIYRYKKDDSLNVIIRYGSEKGGFEFKEAQEMIQDIVEYQQELKAYSVPMPPINNIFIEFHPLNKKAIIIKTSQWTGNDAEEIIAACGAENHKQYLERVIKDMFKIIKPLCLDRFSGVETKLGIDPRPSNFTIDKNGKMWYVDLFPPRHRKQNQPIVEWPAPKTKLGQELGYFKHFDVRGIILCMLSQLVKIKPEMKQIFERIVLEESRMVMSGEEYQEFINVLKTSPWQKLRDIMDAKVISNDQCQEEVKHLIMTSLDRNIFGIDYNIYTLRELALELTYRGFISKKELGNFFQRSHFEDGLSEETISQLQKDLHQKVIK